MASLFERRKDLISSITRDAIYEATVSVLAKYGLRGATMDRVAACAGVAKGSLYNYFDSKDDLLTFVYERTMQPLRDGNNRIATTDVAADAKLEALIRSWDRFVEEFHIGVQVFVEGLSCERVLEAEIRKSDQQTIALLTDIVTQGISSGQFRHVNARCFSEILLTTIKGIFAAELVHKIRDTHDEMIDTLVHVFVGGLVTASTETPGAKRNDADPPDSACKEPDAGN